MRERMKKFMTKRKVSSYSLVPSTAKNASDFVAQNQFCIKRQTLSVIVAKMQVYVAFFQIGMLDFQLLCPTFLFNPKFISHEKLRCIVCIFTHIFC